MGIAAKSPRGGLVETLAGAPRVLILRNAEIERFEDQHRGIFDLWDGIFGRGTKPKSAEVRDLVALGLVGGGMADPAADALISGLGPEENLRLYQIAQGLVGVAFLPGAAEDDSATGEGAPAPGTKKKTKAAPAAGGV